MLYVDTSALMKRYLPEPDDHVALTAMADDPLWVTSPLTEVEARRTLTRDIKDSDELDRLRADLRGDLAKFVLVQLDAAVFRDAAEIAEQTLCRSLDSIHLAAARSVSPDVTVLTFDHRQAEAARSLGLATVGI